MIARSVRQRMLLIAIVPVTLVATLVVAIFWFGRIADQDKAYQERNEYLVRQMAVASEYGVFSGNLGNLRSVLASMVRQPDVLGAGVFDRNGELIAGSNTGFARNLHALDNDDYRSQQAAQGIDVLVKPVEPTQILVEDMYSGDASSASTAALGHVVLEVSQQERARQRRDTTIAAVAVWFVGVSVGIVLALRLGLEIANPLLRISNVIQRIGRGDFSITSNFKADDPLASLQHELNRMAARLAWGRIELEKQVELVTAELKVKKEEAEAATRAKSMFLAAASHDLRQPTHALGMFTARLKQYRLEPEVQDLANYLQASVNSMQDLLDGLLDISRLESGTVQVSIREIPLAPILSAVRTALDPLAANKGLQFKVRSTKLWCRTDPLLMQRIVMNLAENALRYTESGTVLITCRPVHAGFGVRIDVSDSGIGIDAADHTAIFSEFFQAANPARDRGKGMGLGLNIVQRTALLLNHTVEMRSSLGCGSRFSILVERCAPTDKVEEVPDPLRMAVGMELQGVKVLLVEDDELVRMAVQMLLQSWGCHVLAIGDPRAAMASLGEGLPPDFILSDYRLDGEVSGLELIQQLRQTLQRDLPACLVSGDTDAGLMHLAASHALPLLHKPVRPAKLRSLMRRLLKTQTS